MITTRPLFEIRLDVPAIVDIGETPLGRRRIATVTGGQFEGERLRGMQADSGAGRLGAWYLDDTLFNKSWRGGAYNWNNYA